MSLPRLTEFIGQELGKGGGTYIDGTTEYTGSYIGLRVTTACTFTTLTLVGNWDGSAFDGLPIGYYPVEFSKIKLATGKAIAYKG